MNFLKFLGTGSAFNVKRGCTSAYFEMGTELFVIDAGEDVFKKLVLEDLFNKKTRVNFFITHIHGDHAGSLSTAIYYLYYKVFNMDKSKICVYFPHEDLREYLRMSGTTEEFYTYYINRWDEIRPDGTDINFEYNFIDAKHVQGMNSYAITIEIPKQKLIYYSGDNSEFNFTVKNVDMYNEIYNEVTFIEKATSHMYYKKMLELTKDFSKEQKSKIILMHLEDDEEAIKLMKENGFTIAE